MKRIIVIAGKNDVACNALRYLIGTLEYPTERVKVVLTKKDDGRNTWQESFAFCARCLGVEIVALDDLYCIKDLLFISLEFDRIIKPNLFVRAELYNFHFSKLPAYKGSGTSVLPILHGETESGVTLHQIDAGVDTGPIVDQVCFKIERSWTSRDLYMKFMAVSLDLFKRNIMSLIDGRVVVAQQSSEGASHYLVDDVGYSRTEICFRKTAYQIKNHVRAYSFWEYQLSTVGGRKVLAAEILGERSNRCPGTEITLSKYESIFSTIDYDVKLKFSPYDDYFAWARGEDDNDAFCYVEDLDKQDPHGWSAAMMAAYYCRSDRLLTLLQKGIDVNQCNRRGTTLLMYAKSGCVRNGCFTCLKLLLQHGASIDAKDAQGNTVFSYLKEEGREDVIEFIKEFKR